MSRTRRGYTLVESLVALTLISTTLTVATIFMHSLHRTERRVRDELQEMRAIDRLAIQLRQDAHQAQTAAISGTRASENNRVTLMLDGNRSIEYSIRPNYVERIARTEQAIDHRDLFRYEQSNGLLSLDTMRDKPLIRLQLLPNRSAPGTNGFAAREKSILATVGLAVQKTN